MQWIAEVPADWAGRWTAWDREQTRIIGAADSFNEVKSIAAESGWREIVIAKVPSRPSLARNGFRLVCIVAVFIAEISSSVV